MCGIVGIVAKSFVNQSIYDALIVLQHRGQDAAGIATWDNDRLFLRKANGLVADVFHTRHMQRLLGCMGLGHVRYPTAGSASSAEAQPFYVNSPYGITLAHNGNLTNADDVAEHLYREDLRHINTSSDSEVLLNVFAHELEAQAQLVLTPEIIFNAVSAVHRRVQGGYAVVAMINGYGLVAFRDPHGIRPVVFGVRESEKGREYMVASESVALDALGYTLVRDIAPGEAIVMTQEGELFAHQCAENPELSPCIFEYVYFARPDSIMDGISVYKARLKMGEYLARKIMRERPDHNIDVVIPIPDTSRTSALQLANLIGVKYREGFIKNRYIGRTFIMPGQSQRKKCVKQKLNAIALEFVGKNVLLVDDSIVRGTTCNQIIQMARDAGAKNVYFASAAPEVRHPNIYGIDMPTSKELIAHGRTVEEIESAIGADWLIYQDLQDLKRSCLDGAITDVKTFDCSVFDAHYVAGDIDAAYFAFLDAARRDASKSKTLVMDDVAIDMNDAQ